MWMICNLEECYIYQHSDTPQHDNTTTHHATKLDTMYMCIYIYYMYSKQDLLFLKSLNLFIFLLKIWFSIYSIYVLYILYSIYILHSPYTSHHFIFEAIAVKLVEIRVL
jgi:hypothetical protein